MEVVTLNAWRRRAEGAEIDCPADLNGRGQCALWETEPRSRGYPVTLTTPTPL